MTGPLLPAAFEEVPFTRHREVVYDLLTRAKRFHCPITSCWEFEVSALEAARRRTRVDGRPVGLAACLVRATGLTVAAHPRLNHHLFHGLLRKREVAFSEARCQLVVVRRGPAGERILLPLIVERADAACPREVQRAIDHHRRAPLEDLPQFRAFEQLKRLPRLALRYLSFKVRSDPRVYARYFGSYGLSAIAARGASAHSLHAVANTGASFLIGGVQDRPVVRDGQVVPGRVLTVACVIDHFLLDGLDVLEAMTTLRRALADPTRLGLEPAPAASATEPTP